MAEWRFEGSPLVLRPLHGGAFELEQGGEALALDHGDDDPGKDEERREEEELLRTENPHPGVGAMLKVEGEEVGELRSEPTGLGKEGVARLGRWVEERSSADRLVVILDSHAITRQEIGRLGRLADRHGVEVEVRLQGDG